MVQIVVLREGLLPLARALVGCDDASPSDEGGIVQEQGSSGYTLEWETTGASVDDTGWSIGTDLGYEARVGVGYIVNYSLQLIPRETARAELPAIEYVRAALRALNLIQTAWAGHGDDNDVTIVFGVVEDLARLFSTTSPDVELCETGYCSLHDLAARADQEVVDRTADVDLERLSVTMGGTWAPPKAGSGEFDIASALAFGVILAQPDERLLTSEAALHFVITRHLDEVFTGVDFATLGTDYM